MLTILCLMSINAAESETFQTLVMSLSCYGVLLSLDVLRKDDALPLWITGQPGEDEALIPRLDKGRDASANQTFEYAREDVDLQATAKKEYAEYICDEHKAPPALQPSW